MELELGPWLDAFTAAVTGAFPGRVVCIGLQGSRGRGEARADSDIDMVVILDRLEYDDLARYRAAVEGLPHRELLCGFVSGREELLAWDPAELFQFYHDTRPVLGDLEFLRGRFGWEDAERAVRAGLCGVYHGCVHNSLHERDPALLAGLYKSAVFTLQARHFLATGRFLRRHRDLLGELEGEEREILRRALDFRAGGQPSLEEDGALLLRWCGRLLKAE